MDKTVSEIYVWLLPKCRIVKIEGFFWFAGKDNFYMEPDLSSGIKILKWESRV